MSRARISIYSSLLCVLAGCAPLPVTYYMPSADHATIRQVSCDQAPPYEAVLDSGILKTSAFFDGRRIVIGFYPSHSPATIEIETPMLQIEVDGKLVGLSNLQYRESLSKVEPLSKVEFTNVRSLDGALRMTGWSAYLVADSPISNPSNLVLHIPSILVDGISIPAETVSFQRESEIRLRFLILNC